MSLFNKDYSYRILEFLFLNSNKVNSINDYQAFKNNCIDFKLPNLIKTEQKLLNCDYPLQRTLNLTFFHNKKIHLFNGVFMPRTETELLVSTTLKWINKLNLWSFSYLDLCSGSGNIFCSLLAHWKHSLTRCAAVDFSSTACHNILKNVSHFNLKQNIKIYQSDWRNFLKSSERWQVITINPPYVSESQYNYMKENRLSQFDPKWSLQAGANGWSHYSKIIKFASTNIFWKLIILEASEFHEHLWDQIVLQSNSFKVHKYKDYLGKFRVVALVSANCFCTDHT